MSSSIEAPDTAELQDLLQDLEFLETNFMQVEEHQCASRTELSPGISSLGAKPDLTHQAEVRFSKTHMRSFEF